MNCLSSIAALGALELADREDRVNKQGSVFGGDSIHKPMCDPVSEVDSQRVRKQTIEVPAPLLRQRAFE